MLKKHAESLLTGAGLLRDKETFQISEYTIAESAILRNI